MPDIRARPWFLRVAKRFGEQLSTPTICEHANKIGIPPNTLIGCIGSSGTETTRKIIREIFSKGDLESKSGPEAVSKETRESIRSKYYHSSFNHLKSLRFVHTKNSATC